MEAEALNIQLLKQTHYFSANCYLISSDGEYAVVDPASAYDPSLIQGRVKYILLTHAHFDHILDIDDWVRGTGATVIISNDEVSALSDPMRNCYKLFNGSDRGYFGCAQRILDGEILMLGEERISFMHTPGHTSGSGIYIIGKSAFVGDTVFAGGGYGRYDLPTGNGVILRESIRRILTLPEDTVLYPGHGEPTTIKQYKLDIK